MPGVIEHRTSLLRCLQKIHLLIYQRGRGHPFPMVASQGIWGSFLGQYFSPACIGCQRCPWLLFPSTYRFFSSISPSQRLPSSLSSWLPTFSSLPSREPLIYPLPSSKALLLSLTCCLQCIVFLNYWYYYSLLWGFGESADKHLWVCHVHPWLLLPHPTYRHAFFLLTVIWLFLFLPCGNKNYIHF